MTSGETPLAAALHRLRSTLARVQAEAEVLELDGVAVGGIVEGLGEAFGHLGDAEDAALGGGEVAATAPGEHGGVVVVIDDDVRLAALTAQRLNSRGIQASAISSIRSLPADAPNPSIVVVDLGLLESANSDELVSLPWSRTIVVSGAEANAANARARLLGAYGFLAKPVRISELTRMISRLTVASG